MDLAPIVLFVYNRPWHTEQTLNALKKNVLSDKSTLYVFCDGPKIGANEEEVKKVNAVRELVKAKQWCKEVHIIERKNNLGLANSVIKGVTEIIQNYGKVIVLEDDIITGTHFLEFMNDALNIYKDNDKVFGISGFKYPSAKTIESDTYFLPIASSWSYATWLNRWDKVNFDSKQLLKTVDELNLKNKMNFGNYPFYQMLQNQVSDKVDSWAIRFYASMFLDNSIFLFPNKPLIKNSGFDNSGTHCTEDVFFGVKDLSHDKIKVIPQELSLNTKIVDLVRQSFENQRVQKNDNHLKKFNLVKKGKQILKKGFGK